MDIEKQVIENIKTNIERLEVTISMSDAFPQAYIDLCQKRVIELQYQLEELEAFYIAKKGLYF